MRNTLEHEPTTGKGFRSLFSSSTNVWLAFLITWWHHQKYFLFLLQRLEKVKVKNHLASLFYFDYQNVNYLCSHHHYDIGLQLVLCALLQNFTGCHFGCRLRAVSLFLENPWGRTQTSKRASVTVSVTCERRCHEPLAASRQAHSHVRTLTCLAFSPTDFRAKEKLLAVNFGWR